MEEKIMKDKMSKVIIALFILAAMSLVTFASYPSYDTETDCRSCHGNTVDRHHNLLANGAQCTDCHVMKYEEQNQTYYPEVIRNCLICHPAQNHIDCIACHSPADVNISLFAGHANINTSGGGDIVTNDDCWTCHYRKDMDKNNVYLCGSCHSNKTGIVLISNDSLVMNDFMHDSTECRTCHAPIVSGYHLNGTVGPLGIVENILRKIINP